MKTTMNRALLKGSLILLVCFGVFNVLNFLFHVVMARVLTLSDYGVLSALLSMVYIFALFSDSILLVITKFTSQEHDAGVLKNFFKRSFRKAFIFSVVLFFAYLLVAVPLSIILKIPYTLLFLNGILIFSVFFLPLPRGILQGKKKFFAFGGSMVIESVAKLGFGILFVVLGLKIYGAIGGFIVGSIVAFLFSFVNIREVLRANEKRKNFDGIYSYTKPTLVITLVVTLFFNIDILIVKSFFASDLVGSYAVASMIAKAIFWGTQPISRAMFPLSAENEKKEKHVNIFGSSFVLLSVLVVVALAIFYFFPTTLIHIFSGKTIPEAARILFYLGIGMSILSFTNLILLYYLSLNKIRSSPSKISIIAGVLIGITVLFGILFAIFPFTFFFIGLIISSLATAVVLIHSLLKKYDLGFLFFVFLEGALLLAFRNDLSSFSIAFITSTTLFLGGVIFLILDS